MTLEEAILRTVASRMNLTIGEVCSPGRRRSVVTARQIAYYLYRKVYLSPTPLSQMGFRIFGLNHDHTTVIHHINAIENYMKVEKRTKVLVDEIKLYIDMIVDLDHKIGVDQLAKEYSMVSNFRTNQKTA